MIAAVSLINVLYLTINCPIDLSGDEAQYWDWSRRLDYSYYSKGPAVAWIIRGSTQLLGNTMFAVRLPAVVMYAGITLGVYALANRVFGSERVALLAAGLLQLSPIFLFLSMAMTIDTPLVLCWTWASYFAALAMFDAKRWAWPVAGLLVGIGFLAKYAALLWLLGLLAFLLTSRGARQRAWWPGIVLAVVLAGACTIPVIAWNWQHDWVSLRHVAKQTGAAGGSILRGNLPEFVGSQIAIVGPTIVMMIGAAVWRLRKGGGSGPALTLWPGVEERKWFLLCIGLSMLIPVIGVSLFAKAQVNWAGPAYVTLIVLAGGFLADRWASETGRRRWRGWVVATVVIGLCAHVIGRDTALIIRALKPLGINEKMLARLDGLSRLRGWKELGVRVANEAAGLAPTSSGPVMILCDDYMQTALMAFYVPGQPRTFYAGSYFTDAKRMTQYDLWDDCRLDRQELIGRNAVYVGKGGPMPDPLPAAFERVERLAEIPVQAAGVRVESFKIWRCWGFKGLSKSNAPRTF